jgi:hypothetical protein
MVAEMPESNIQALANIQEQTETLRSELVKLQRLALLVIQDNPSAVNDALKGGKI